MHARWSVTSLVPGLAAAAAVVGACGEGGAAAREAVPDDPDAVVVAEDMAFEPEELRLPAGEPATIVIDNRDEGVNHNIHLEGAPEPDRTPLEPGRSRQALTVELEPGRYTFVCDIHPNMEGEAVAE